MRPVWNSFLEATIERLRRDAIHGDSLGSMLRREAAMNACGLPVYCDAAGCLVITAKGEVVFYDADTQQVFHDVQPGWQVLALVAASEGFIELRALRPKVPAKSTACLQCAGNGKVTTQQFWCGKCCGTGWIGEFEITSGGARREPSQI